MDKETWRYGDDPSNVCVAVGTGEVMNLLAPNPRLFDIDNIAHALSQLCRYTGQCKRFYSVAQHSVLVSTLLPPPLQLTGLLHDASEAFLGDVSRPLKQLLPVYKELEHRFSYALHDKFGGFYPHPPELRDADRLAYEIEVQVLFDKPWVECPVDVQLLSALTSAQAKAAFLDRYRELTNDAA